MTFDRHISLSACLQRGVADLVTMTHSWEESTWLPGGFATVTLQSHDHPGLDGLTWCFVVFNRQMSLERRL
jgi:hypothetical protein